MPAALLSGEASFTSSVMFSPRHLFIFMCMSVLPKCTSVCVTFVAGVLGDQKRAWMYWDWHSRLFRATMWVLGFKPGSSARAATDLNLLSHLSAP